MSKAILFVYGTLKRGGRNHRLLVGQEFLGEVVSAPRYRLIDLGCYPGLIHDEATGLAIHGELYAVGADNLAELDDFEEVPELFIRKAIELMSGSLAWAYFWNQAIPPKARSGARWPFDDNPVFLPEASSSRSCSP
ncbi:MAG: gamma-glutamylcyclotransferase family protein [Gemmataceae bacterium]|nr:gamma-glutamylcyclotransferase [Gemmata sp.]MDW8197722.1 gamma-glutamylcyclotransferase family protein [Gemmataceae bacterium]